MGNIFTNILSITFKHGSEKVLIKLLLKLNIFGFINEAVNEIYKNEILVAEIPIESFFHNLKKLIKMIDDVMNVLKIFSL